MCECVLTTCNHVVHVEHVHAWCLQRQGGIRSPGIAIADSCEPP